MQGANPAALKPDAMVTAVTDENGKIPTTVLN
jgi:hypothetical protein